MAIPQTPENTIATKWIVPGVTDLVFRNDPLLGFMKKNRRVRYEGGPSWQTNFEYAASFVEAHAPGASFEIPNKQLATGTTITPRYYNTAVSAQLEKIRVEMNGPRAVFSYIDLLLSNAAKSMSAKLANDMYRHGQSLSGSDRAVNINGLDEALNDGSTNGFDGRSYPTYLGVTRSDVDSALNSPMTGPAASVPGGIISYPTLETAYTSVMIGPEMPDLMVTTNLGLSYIKMNFQPQQRFENEVDPDLGFQTLRFNGAKIVVSQYAPGTRTATAADALVGYSAIAGGETLWYLNTKWFDLYISTDPLYNFGFTGFLPAQDNAQVVGHYKVALNFICTGSRYNRYLFGILG